MAQDLGLNRDAHPRELCSDPRRNGAVTEAGEGGEERTQTRRTSTSDNSRLDTHPVVQCLPSPRVDFVVVERVVIHTMARLRKLTVCQRRGERWQRVVHVDAELSLNGDEALGAGGASQCLCC